MVGCSYCTLLRPTGRRVHCRNGEGWDLSWRPSDLISRFEPIQNVFEMATKLIGQVSPLHFLHRILQSAVSAWSLQLAVPPKHPRQLKFAFYTFVKA